jgi:hypothetical protein
MAAEQRRRQHRDIGEVHVGGAAAVQHAIGPQCEPAYLPGQDEDSNAIVAEPGRNEQHVCHRATEHDLLSPLQHVSAARALRASGRLLVVMGKG